jgi:cell division protein FtsW (lipid II flippase)
MSLRDVIARMRRGRGGGDAGPVGVRIRLREHNLPGAERRGRVLPSLLWFGLVLGVVFYVLAHLSVVTDVWPVHGTAGGAGPTLIRDMAALGAWLALLAVLRWMGYRGRWAIVVLPVLIFSLARPALFQVFTDPAYQAAGRAKSEANDAKATRSRIDAIERAYSPERQRVVFAGQPPAKPSPFETAVRGQTWAGLFSHVTVFIAPVALLVGFLVARGRGMLRWVRDHRMVPFVPVMGVFCVLAFFFTTLGKVGGTTPWELFLPIFVVIWAATLADDAYNLAQPGAVMEPRRLVNLFVYGALPVIPFLQIHELGLSIVLVSSLAAMLLVGTRKGWWAALMMAVWAVMVTAVFNLDDRSVTRFQLAYHPYRPLAEMTAPEQERWAAKLHQMKLFDANVLAGGLVGEGPGRGHGETAPNAADDGYITLYAAQWGWAGGVALVLVYTLFLVTLLAAAVRERGAFERTLATGVALLLGTPFWLAALGGVRVVPLTGVAAAFAAHGGAKLLASAFAVGLVAGLSHRRTEEDRLESALAAPVPETADRGVRIR